MMSYDYPHPVSRTYQYKKITKPLLERKRRARINRCLDELKELMVDALETEGENISKLEKADILELTVRHLQRLHASRPSGLSSIISINGDGNNESRWQSGFGHCAAEACKYLAALPGESGEKLARHLASGLESSRKINIPIMSEGEIISPITKNADTNSNHPDAVSNNVNLLPIAKSHKSPSPINSRQYCEVYEKGRNILAINLQAEESISNPDVLPSPPLPPANDNINVMAQNPAIDMVLMRNERYEDDEEIDVERIDEKDPMWRPW